MGIKNIIVLLVLVCQNVFAFTSYEEFQEALKVSRSKVPVFREASQIASKHGFRIFLFGGTATSFARYVLWELESKSKNPPLKNRSFDYSVDDIFTYTQDFDFAIEKIDGSEPSEFELVQFEKELRDAIPERRTEVSALQQSYISLDGRRRLALSTDAEFYKQHSDSLSFGLIDLNTSEFKVLDLRKRDGTKAEFLQHLLEEKIEYYYSANHSETARSKEGLNPEIFSVIRYLIKVFRYDLKIPEEGLNKIRSIIKDFNPNQIKDGYAKNWIEKNAKKLFLEALDLEKAWAVLEGLGLRSKLIKIGNPDEMGSLAWLMSRKPLPSKPWTSSDKLQGPPKTARDLGISIVAHQTSRIEWLQSLTRNPHGKLNAFISETRGGMNAKFGEGFYVSKGITGAGNTTHSSGNGRNVILEVDPTAEEGIDFVRVFDQDFNKEHILFLNASKLTVLSLPQKSEAIGLVEKILNLSSIEHWKLAVGYLKKLRSLQITEWEMREIEHMIFQTIPKSLAARKSHIALLFGDFKSDFDLIQAINFSHKSRSFDLPLIAATAALFLKKNTKPHIQIVLLNALIENNVSNHIANRIISDQFLTPEDYFRFFEIISGSFSDRSSQFYELVYQFVALQNISIEDIHTAETKLYGAVDPFFLKNLAIKRGLVKSMDDFLNLALLIKPSINGVETWRFGNGDLNAAKLYEAFINNASESLYQRYIAWIEKNIDFFLSLKPSPSDVHILARIIGNRDGKISLKRLLIDKISFSSAHELIDFFTPENNPPSEEYHGLTSNLVFENIEKLTSFILTPDDIRNTLRVVYEDQLAMKLRQVLLSSGAIVSPQQYLALFDYPFSSGENSDQENSRREMIVENTENFLRSNPSFKEIHDYVLLAYTYKNKSLIKEKILRSGFLKSVDQVEDLFSFEIIPPSKDFQNATKEVLLRNQDILLSINPDKSAWNNLMKTVGEKISSTATPRPPLVFQQHKIPLPQALKPSTINPPKRSPFRCLMRIATFGLIK